MNPFQRGLSRALGDATLEIVRDETRLGVKIVGVAYTHGEKSAISSLEVLFYIVVVAYHTCPLLLRLLTSAPFRRQSLAILLLPFWAATWRRVNPTSFW